MKYVIPEDQPTTLDDGTTRTIVVFYPSDGASSTGEFITIATS